MRFYLYFPCEVIPFWGMLARNCGAAPAPARSPPTVSSLGKRLNEKNRARITAKRTSPTTRFLFTADLSKCAVSPSQAFSIKQRRLGRMLPVSNWEQHRLLRLRSDEVKIIARKTMGAREAVVSKPAHGPLKRPACGQLGPRAPKGRLEWTHVDMVCFQVSDH